MQNTSKLSDTDLCVMCGMCLPLCPTYQLYQTETESPRGRIALMQAINRQQIKPDKKALLHIDHCLSCLNCQTICPSKVPYGALIDEFRDQFQHKIKKNYLSQLVLKQATKPDGINKFISLTHKPVIKQLISLSSSILNTPNIHSTKHPEFKRFYASTLSKNIAAKGTVTLFIGCVGSSHDYNTVIDAIQLLNLFGFSVAIPKEQQCCGALHQHNGHQVTAKSLINKNQAILDKEKTDALLFFSPACGESLKQLSQRCVVDVRRFIFDQLKQSPLSFSTPDKPVALHESCSHRNRLKQGSLNIDLLNCISNIRIIKSSQPALCCGAGGIQSINYPEQAQAFLQGVLKSFDLTQTDILISDNIGCSLHIKTAVSAYNQNLEIIHPISLLARQLITQ